MTNLKSVPICELFEELKKREGVETLVCPDPSWEYYVETISNCERSPYDDLSDEDSRMGTGPATILVVID